MKVKAKTKEKRNGRWREEFQRADRSADPMFRSLLANHFRLSAMADTKAHIMITICAGIIGLSIKQLFDPQLFYATITLITCCLVALIFAVYSTMPKLSSSKSLGPDDSRFNVVFFSNFAQLPYDRFEAEMEKIIRDQQLIHRSMITDLYELGRVLATKKYRYLRYCYLMFLAGLILSAVVLGISYTLSATP